MQRVFSPLKVAFFQLEGVILPFTMRTEEAVKNKGMNKKGKRLQTALLKSVGVFEDPFKNCCCVRDTVNLTVCVTTSLLISLSLLLPQIIMLPSVPPFSLSLLSAANHSFYPIFILWMFVWMLLFVHILVHTFILLWMRMACITEKDPDEDRIFL